ncbi:MAG: aminotransferase class IV [Bellilinea sp.]
MASILSFRYLNGDYSSSLVSNPLESDITTLDQASNLLPAGAYTTFRTYQKYSALHLNDHLRRLETSAGLAGHPIRLDTDQLRRNLRVALTQYPGSEARVRLTIPFGLDAETIYIHVDALSVPTAVQYANGVKTLTAQMQRNNPSAKLSNFIQSSREARRRLPEGFEEIFMVDERGNILEGLTSNFYAVMGGEIWTAGQGMLSGITRQIVLLLAEDAGCPVHLEAPELSNLFCFAEAFITSTSRAVLPVTEIDYEPVGDGKPGPITRKLMQMYDKKVMAEIEPI